MKKFLLSVSVLTLQLFFFNPAIAEISIVTVDVATLYDNYFKTKEAGEKLQGRFDTAKTQLDQMIADGEVEVESYKTMVEQAQNPALSETARTEAEKDADIQMQKIRTMQQEVQMFRESTNNQLSQQQNTQRQFMLEEIKTIILDFAQQKGADLVFDTSTGVNVGLPPVIYANPAWDSTDEVLEVLNADAPAEAAAATPQ